MTLHGYGNGFLSGQQTSYSSALSSSSCKARNRR
jgi:hypothetical protein